LCEEEEESEDEALRDAEGLGGDGTADAQGGCNAQSGQDQAEQMIEQLHDGILPRDDCTETMSNAELDKLSYLDFEGLRKAHGFIQGQEA